MKNRDLRDYLSDLIEACQDILSFTKGMSYDNFIQDKKTINAVVRSLEVIGEASKNMPIHFRENYPNIPWKQMAGMRDKLIHEYFGIDKEMVWQVIGRHIPHILPLLKKISLDNKK
ncbi:MAG: DUF86 domain-containing protein [Candidatus Omnitrophica bacterium]|nr:DUF86 domain-containing protein [Candidatus Omnitrophota bacterium]